MHCDQLTTQLSAVRGALLGCAHLDRHFQSLCVSKGQPSNNWGCLRIYISPEIPILPYLHQQQSPRAAGMP